MSMARRSGIGEEEQNTRQFKAVTTLMNGAQYDARRRFDILTEEIDHLLRYLRFRIGPSTEFDQPGDRFRKPYDSQQAFLVRLGYAGLALQKECAADGGEANLTYERFKSCWLAVEKRGGRRSECLREKRDLLRQQVLWIAKIVTKASVIAERLGELHDRLQQFLQRTNPDHPEPTLRRRLEHGLADKYLSELARWVHKDIAQLCSRRYAGTYPTEFVPSTFQFWGYGHVSSHHSFVTLDEHLRTQKGLESNAKDSLSQARFTSIAFSYWIPERPALAPLIGHEVARQVLRAIYGRNTQSSVLEQDRSALGEAYRALVDCAEKWLAVSARSREVDADLPMQLATEVMSDALAATRFGWSYAYAFALQMMSDGRFAALFEDSSGMLMRVSLPTHAAAPSQPSPASSASSHGTGALPCELCQTPLKAGTTCQFCTAFHHRDRDARVMSAGLKAYLPLDYYRGRALLSFLQHVYPSDGDPFAQDLNEAFDCLLTAVLCLFTEDEVDHVHHAQQFASALADGLCRTGHKAPSRLVHSARMFVQRTASSGDLSNFFNPAMARQTLSPSFRAFLFERLDSGLGARDAYGRMQDPRRRSFAPACCPGLVDAVWRIEWLVASSHKSDRDPDLMKNAQALRRRSREVLAVGIDDYLFRTGSPTTLFETLNEGEPPQDFSDLLRDHNKLDNMDGAYSLDALIELDTHLTRRRQQAFTFNFQGKTKRKVPIVVPAAQLKWLPDRIIDGSWHKLWLDRPNKPPVRDSIVILDLLCLKSELCPRLMNGADAALAQERDRALASLGGALTIRSSDIDRYNPFASGPLLGRYDAFVFYTQGSTDINSPTSARWKWDISYEYMLGHGISLGAKNKEVLTAYVSRTKRLVRVWGERPTLATSNAAHPQPSDSTWPLIEESETLGLVLVSLKWDASRSLVARWLARHVSEKAYGLDWAVFLSDGWEDLVVVVGVPKGFRGAGLPEKYEKFVAFVEELNRSPFVASTETLFSQTLLQAPPPCFSFRFTVRLGRHRHENVLQKIETLGQEHVERGGTADVRNVAGNRDIDMLVSPAPSAGGASDADQGLMPRGLQTLHLSMRRELSGYAKFETRVAWKV